MKVSRRSFLKAAAAIGASLAWGGPARGSRVQWKERRDLYPQGVASGDPDPHSVILWTRRPFAQGTRQLLTVEVAEDEAFRRVIAQAQAPVSSAADWTARVKTKDLNDWLYATIARHPPPAVRGKRIKPRYLTQIKARPPTFVLISSRAEEMPESYKRYLVNGLRDAFDLHAAPVRLIVKAGKNPFTDDG